MISTELCPPMITSLTREPTQQIDTSKQPQPGLQNRNVKWKRRGSRISIMKGQQSSPRRTRSISAADRIMSASLGAGVRAPGDLWLLAGTVKKRERKSPKQSNIGQRKVMSARGHAAHTKEVMSPKNTEHNCRLCQCLAQVIFEIDRKTRWAAGQPGNWTAKSKKSDQAGQSAVLASTQQRQIVLKY